MEMTAETKTQRPKTELGVYQLRITLQEIRPPVWRLVQIPDTLRLSRLHDVLQAVIGWTDSHLHRFEKDGRCWGVPEPDEDDGIEIIDETRTRSAPSLRHRAIPCCTSMTMVTTGGTTWCLKRFCQQPVWSIQSALPANVTAHRRTSEACPDTRNSWRSSSNPATKSMNTTYGGLKGHCPSIVHWDASSRKSST